MEPRNLQRYRLLDELGQGGMAVVYRGVDASLEREVAVKLLHRHLSSRPEHRRRLLREARAVARLKHPNILEIYDFSGEDAPEAFLVMELIRGPTLKAFVTEHPADPPELGAAVAWLLAGALEHAHAHNVVHRDLKPENVMVQLAGPQPTIKLMDFGIAHIADRDDRMTITGSLVGTPTHMAPEIVDGEDADARSDIYSLGVILYSLVTGELPFNGQSPGALLKRIAEGIHIDARELKPGVSDALASVIERMLARRPERIQTASEVRRELAAVLAQGGIDRPEELVNRYVTAPEEARTETRVRVIATLMQDGERALTERRTARALSAFSRVIHVAPGTVEAGAARAAIDRLKARARWRRRGLAAASIAGVVLAGAGVVAFTKRGETAVSASPPPEMVVAAPISPAPETKTTAMVETKLEPAPTTEPTPPSPEPTAPQGSTTIASSPLRPIKPHTPTDAKAVSRTPAPASPARLEIQVLPFARITIDGRQVAETRAWAGEIPPGPHRVELAHDCCVTQVLDETFEAGRTREWREKLVPRDGGLAINVHGPADAGVMLDNEFQRYLSERRDAPVAVKMGRDGDDRWRYDRKVRVRLFADGYKDWVKDVLVRAGQLVPLDVTLEPKG